MSYPSIHRPRASCAVGLLLAVCSAGAANAEPTSAVRAQAAQFDVSPQPLTAALEAYSMTSGVQILYDSRLASGLHSSGAKGYLTPQAALQLLLRETGLVPRYTDSNDVVLVPVAAQPSFSSATHSAGGPALSLETLRVEDAAVIGDIDEDRLGHRIYASVVQADIRRALQEHADTRSGSYRIGLKLWVDRSGAVERTDLLRSSGDSGRDAAVTHALRDLTISQAPPRDLPQPLNVMILVQGP